MSIEENIREFGFDAMSGAEMARRLRNCSELWAAGDRWDEAFIESIARRIESRKSILDALDAAEKALEVELDFHLPEGHTTSSCPTCWKKRHALAQIRAFKLTRGR